MADNVQPDPTQAATTPTQSTEPQPFNIPDDAMVEIQVRGEKVLKPWKEARGNVQMQEDYTRSKQDLAKQAKEISDLYTTLKSRESSIAEKEAALDRILGRSTPADDKKGDIADDEVLTGKQARELLAKQRAEFESTLETKLGEQSSQAQRERLFQRWEDLTSEAVTALKSENPVLSHIPQLDLVLKREALQDKPQTEAEMKQAILKAGQRLAAKLDEEYKERRKAEVARKQELTSKGPTRSSGGPQFQPPQKAYGQRGKINWDELERDAITAVEALEE